MSKSLTWRLRSTNVRTHPRYSILVLRNTHYTQMGSRRCSREIYTSAPEAGTLPRAHRDHSHRTSFGDREEDRKTMRIEGVQKLQVWEGSSPRCTRLPPYPSRSDLGLVVINSVAAFTNLCQRILCQVGLMEPSSDIANEAIPVPADVVTRKQYVY
jgi:hypothetical protein